MTSATAPLPAEPERRIPGVTPALRRRLRFAFALLSALSPTLAARLALRMFLTPRRRAVVAGEAAFLAGAHRHALRVATEAGDSYVVQAYEWPAAGAATVLVMHGLCLRIAEAAVVFDDARCAGRIDHEAGIQEARVRRAIGRQARERGLDHLAHDARVHGGRDYRRG